LPEAHVEAPTIGSVILAALLLKLGTYGIIRFLLHLFPEATLYFSPLVNVFALISIVFTSLTAIRQIDLKKIIAYSSVGHMNVVLLGMLVPSIESLEGSIFQMLSHGIISGALFFIVGAFYQRYKVRSLEYFGGFMITAPLLSTFFLIFSMANISFPGTSSFIGEFMICFGVFEFNSFAVLIASINMVTGAAYTL
jgi:NADH:ubiquinone oxidoreductase subunit 4 (subunit M)